VGRTHWISSEGDPGPATLVILAWAPIAFAQIWLWFDSLRAGHRSAHYWLLVVFQVVPVILWFAFAAVPLRRGSLTWSLLEVPTALAICGLLVTSILLHAGRVTDPAWRRQPLDSIGYLAIAHAATVAILYPIPAFFLYWVNT